MPGCTAVTCATSNYKINFLNRAFTLMKVFYISILHSLSDTSECGTNHQTEICIVKGPLHTLCGGLIAAWSRGSISHIKMLM